MAKMDQLDKVEKEIVSCLLTAGQALAEISKVGINKRNLKQYFLWAENILSQVRYLFT